MSLFRSRWPRTLLWQTFLVIAVVAGDGACRLVPDISPSPARSAGKRSILHQMVVSVVNLTRTALINAEFRDRRRELLIDLAALEGIPNLPCERED